MRIATLDRGPSTEHGTIGLFTLHQGPTLCTMELPWRENAAEVSCIPPGEYVVEPYLSPTFGRCYHVTDVQDRTWILFHSGNVAGNRDLGYHTHSLGCILPGLRSGWLTVKGRRQRAVLASRTGCRHLDKWAGRRPFRLRVN